MINLLKKRYKLILLFVSFLFLINIVSAASKTYNFLYNNNPISGAQLYIYGCTDSSCSSLITPYWNSPTSTATDSIIVSGIPSSYNKEFHYIGCYKPLESSARPPGFYDGTTSSLTMSKQASCSSTPSNLQITGTKQVNNQLTITVNLAEVFSSSVTNLPNEVINFYEGDTDIELWINNQKQETKNVKIPIGGTTTTFQWTPSTAGDYTIKIKTHITDCQCSSVSDLETSTSITISSPPPTCTPSTCSLLAKNCGTWDNGCGTNINCGTCTTGQTCNTTGQCVTSAVTQQKCSDNTLYNQCSTTKPKYCLDGNLMDKCSQCSCPSGLSCTANENCIINLTIVSTQQQICKENWQCSDWSDCINGIKTKVCNDENNCGTTVYKPNTEEACIPETITETTEEASIGTKIKQFLKPGEEKPGLYVLVEPKLSVPISILIITALFVYIYLHHLKATEKPKKIRLKEKIELKPVKVNDLMLGIINSLDEDERAICNRLLEGEGIRQNDLRNALGIPKARFEIALQKLERRQIIKEREGNNPQIFFNDWLK